MANRALFQQPTHVCIPMWHAMNRIRCCSSALVHVTRSADELLLLVWRAYRGLTYVTHFYIRDRSHATSTLETIKGRGGPGARRDCPAFSILAAAGSARACGAPSNRELTAPVVTIGNLGEQRGLGLIGLLRHSSTQLLTALGNHMYNACKHPYHATPHIHLFVLCWVLQSLRSADLLINLWHRLSC
ncbi:hypothetical protein HBI56_202750 [Parastagonospora nodorum]|uniref:Uncharacterized protein n=1 Tax=Phaeosphaeria nodorum (strain SN15 / ATCC MYA-4574 / FGSC 10173) TaxID=321614 RepID=A0A7U2FEH0_PHANO|nr:hypothetical protein HBH56_143340 [Parastagonospora nodorum]QRD01495.1 hypothetical protein JI435_416790 [Parastagonospora nodorum SN15]KAH3927672.1 hypothetical protein HBH54_148530 [Parastagonospora nodorum]KAH3947868.1 hypothetical protein HBH53_108580 [Parastagonospora nodorum]KAH3961929.1 hypothetical protein HBH51_178470 [Parastagonospora nodorum]